ncbi:hypothetical protein DBV15_04990 [Temnothorax longispinosus]|uniref:Uncharacterized protein n=1 Tax=Temnothorax longispinosus TaxID=300112 RepID=A0A4S2KIQ8_9HYME|nr:hypothetical protein DBV15_04990 [Temnothorax longispinosus]
MQRWGALTGVENSRSEAHNGPFPKHLPIQKKSSVRLFYDLVISSPRDNWIGSPKNRGKEDVISSSSTAYLLQGVRGAGGGLARSAGSHWFAVGPYYKRLQSALVNVSSNLHERRRISLVRRRRRRRRRYYCYYYYDYYYTHARLYIAPEYRVPHTAKREREIESKEERQRGTINLRDNTPHVYTHSISSARFEESSHAFVGPVFAVVQLLFGDACQSVKSEREKRAGILIRQYPVREREGNVREIRRRKGPSFLWTPPTRGYQGDPKARDKPGPSAKANNEFALRVESRGARQLLYAPRDSAPQSGILSKERSLKCLGIERAFLRVIDPRVKIAAKRNRDARILLRPSMVIDQRLSRTYISKTGNETYYGDWPSIYSSETSARHAYVDSSSKSNGTSTSWPSIDGKKREIDLFLNVSNDAEQDTSPSECTRDLNRTNRRSEKGRDTPFGEKPSRRRRESGASRAREIRYRERRRRDAKLSAGTPVYPTTSIAAVGRSPRSSSSDGAGAAAVPLAARRRPVPKRPFAVQVSRECLSIPLDAISTIAIAMQHFSVCTYATYEWNEKELVRQRCGRQSRKTEGSLLRTYTVHARSKTRGSSTVESLALESLLKYRVANAKGVVPASDERRFVAIDKYYWTAPSIFKQCTKMVRVIENDRATRARRTFKGMKREISRLGHLSNCEPPHNLALADRHNVCVLILMFRFSRDASIPDEGCGGEVRCTRSRAAETRGDGLQRTTRRFVRDSRNPASLPSSQINECCISKKDVELIKYLILCAPHSAFFVKDRVVSLKGTVLPADFSVSRFLQRHDYAHTVHGTPVEHSFTNARACEPIDAARGYVRHIRHPCVLINSAALPDGARRSERTEAKNRGPRSRKKKERKNGRIEGSIADKRTSGGAKSVLLTERSPFPGETRDSLSRPPWVIQPRPDIRRRTRRKRSRRRLGDKSIPSSSEISPMRLGRARNAAPRVRLSREKFRVRLMGRVERHADRNRLA